jgi:hypothetical protein
MRSGWIKGLALLVLVSTGACANLRLIETGQAGKAWVVNLNNGQVYNCEANGPQAVCFPANTN